MRRAASSLVGTLDGRVGVVRRRVMGSATAATSTTTAAIRSPRSSRAERSRDGSKVVRYHDYIDEKIEGTVHLAIGNGFPFIGGTNVSAVHWDLVKDLRRGGRIELDGGIVQENGAWQL